MMVTAFFFAEIPLQIAIWGVVNCSIGRREKRRGETIASTASEYPLAILALGNPPPKPEKCLLGTSQTLIRKEARYHDGKPKTKYPGEVLCDRRGKGTDGTEDGPAPDKADRRLPAEDGD